LEEIDFKLQRKELLNQSKDNQKRCEDQELVTKLCALVGIKASEDNVGKRELVHFDKLKAAELKAFIIARHPTFMKISEVAHLKNPKGGKSIEEAEWGVDNCISVAFGVRSEKSRLLAITYLHDDTKVIGANISAPLISNITLHGNSTEIKPSAVPIHHYVVRTGYHVYGWSARRCRTRLGYTRIVTHQMGIFLMTTLVCLWYCTS
jgi:hypothetical protein